MGFHVVRLIIDAEAIYASVVPEETRRELCVNSRGDLLSDDPVCYKSVGNLFLSISPVSPCSPCLFEEQSLRFSLFIDDSEGFSELATASAWLGNPSKW